VKLCGAAYELGSYSVGAGINTHKPGASHEIILHPHRECIGVHATLDHHIYPILQECLIAIDFQKKNLSLRDKQNGIQYPGRRDKTHNRYFPTFEALRLAIDAGLSRFQNDPSAVKQLMGPYLEQVAALALAA
jgi:hypothetical protein